MIETGNDALLAATGALTNVNTQVEEEAEALRIEDGRCAAAPEVTDPGRDHLAEEV
jgi:hypothetical protein